MARCSRYRTGRTWRIRNRDAPGRRVIETLGPVRDSATLQGHVLVDAFRRPGPSEPSLHPRYDGTSTKPSRKSLAEAVSSRYVTSVALHTMSPVTVIDTIRLDSTPPRKCGPPESPKQVPPSPVAWFMERVSQAG